MKNTSIKVLQYPALYSSLARFRCKKDIPKGMQYSRILLCDFGLWGKWYLVAGFGGLIKNDGSEMPFHIAYLNTGSVIGHRDAGAADGTNHAEGWRESVHAAIQDRLALL